MNKDIIPFLMDMARMVPGVDMGAALARGVQGRGGAEDAMAFLPFLAWSKKAKKLAGAAGGRVKDLKEDMQRFGRFLGFGEGSEAAYVKRMAQGAGREARATQSAQALRAGERQWAQGIGGPPRAALPLQPARLAAHEIGGSSVPFFQRHAGSAADERLAEEMFRNMERFK